MKSLENKLTDLDGDNEKADYRTVLSACVEHAKENINGQYQEISVKEMRIRINLLDIIEGEGDMEFEDSIAESIKKYVLMRGEMGWANVTKEQMDSIVAFEDDVLGMFKEV